MSSDSSEAKRTAQNHTLRSKGVKRKQPPVYDSESLSGSLTSKDTSITCPICKDTIQDAYMTECGHSFCLACIQLSLDKQNKCPKCQSAVNAEKIFPNFALGAVISQQNRKLQVNQRVDGSLIQNFAELLDENNISGNAASYEDLSSLIELLHQKRQCLLLESDIGQARITLEYLNQLHKDKQNKMEELQKQISLINSDISQITSMSCHLKQTYESCKKATLLTPALPSAASTASAAAAERSLVNGETSSTSSSPAVKDLSSAVRQRMSTHFNELHDLYFNMRSKALVNQSHDKDATGLENFSSALSKFVKYKEFRQLATLNYTSDMYNMYSIVSSIEFDKDADFFAIAGVTKKIKVYDYRQVVTDVVDMHYPITEMSCAQKISCIAWNPYHKNELVSSDYEGTVTMWDPFTTKKIKAFQEHDKRCWCVDYNRMNPHLLASGSDDTKVKIWHTKSPRSILNIEAVANVCCVKFNPSSSYHLAFGAADHCVHYYDLRKTNEALLTFKGHYKAVSYAKFLNGEEIVSASTDSQLKLWNVNKGTSAVRTFQGHINEKNFVGLASDSDYIACGSEDNSLCIYYKGLSRVLHKYKFDIVRTAWQRDIPPKEEDSNEFVSAVAWKPECSVVVVANSQGIVKVLELV